jgi:phosphatidylserine decarboxylase
MAHVSSVALTAVAGRHMAKGEEWLLSVRRLRHHHPASAGCDPQIDTSEEFRLVGTPVARCRARSS